MFPDLAEGEDVAKVVEELKVEVATEFDRGFEAALDQLKVVYLEEDVEKFDLDQVVFNGQIVDPVEVGNRNSSSVAVPDAQQNPQQEPLDLTSLDHFLNEDDELDA